MPTCGCPDMKLEKGAVRACACTTPCGARNLDGCSYNKQTGCAYSSTSTPATSCVCSSNACSCSECQRKTTRKGACCARV